jgi:carboxyl-terminal processing protease
MMKSLPPLGPSRTVFLLLSLLLLLPVAAGTLRQVSAQSEDSGDDSLYKHLSVFTEVLSLIQRSYVDETSLAKLFAGALDGTTDALDSLATYVPAPNVEAYEMAVAIGSGHSGLTIAREAGISFVVAVDSGSPGEKAGVESGDVLAEIGDRSTREMALWESQMLLANESGNLRVELLRRGQSKEVELTLGPFVRTMPSVAVEEGTPVLRIAAFSDSAVANVEALIGEEPIAESPQLVIDVRGVAGGSIEAAYSMAGLFFKGDLGELRGRSETLAKYSSDKDPRWTGRLAVLSDGGCQGPSEVFLAAIKEAPGIEIVGSRTFGHAARRSSLQMSTGATLFFADAFYAGPDGEVIDQGLEPEVSVQANRQTLGGRDSGPDDPVLRRALELMREEERQAA